jgi:trimeric autotransporter adhesin
MLILKETKITPEITNTIKPLDKEMSPTKLVSVKKEITIGEMQSPSKSLISSPTKLANQSPISTRSTRRSSDIAAVAIEEKKQTPATTATSLATKVDKSENDYSSSEEDLPLVKYQLKIKSKKLEQIQEQSTTKTSSPPTNPEGAASPSIQASKTEANLFENNKSKFSVFEWKPDVETSNETASNLTKSPSKSKLTTNSDKSEASTSQDKTNETNLIKIPGKVAAPVSSMPIASATSPPSTVEPVITKKSTSTTSTVNITEKSISTISSSSSSSTTSSAKSPSGLSRRSKKIPESSSSVHSSNNSSSNSLSSSSASSSSASSTVSNSGSGSDEEIQAKQTTDEKSKNKNLTKKMDSKTANKVSIIKKTKETSI